MSRKLALNVYITPAIMPEKVAEISYLSFMLCRAALHHRWSHYVDLVDHMRLH